MFLSDSMTEIGARPLTSSEVEKFREWWNDRTSSSLESLKTKYTRFQLLDLRDGVYCELGLRTGFRISEILSLQWYQIWDFSTNQGKDRLVIGRENMKGKKRKRSLPLGLELKRCFGILKEQWSYIYERDLTPKDYVFQGIHPFNKKMHPSTIHRRLRKLFSTLQFQMDELSSHSLRKTFVKEVYEACGKDLVTTAKYTGHQSVNTLMSYLRPNCDGIEDFLKQ